VHQTITVKLRGILADLIRARIALGAGRSSEVHDRAGAETDRAQSRCAYGRRCDPARHGFGNWGRAAIG
jgi:hypothetical protein